MVGYDEGYGAAMKGAMLTIGNIVSDKGSASKQVTIKLNTQTPHILVCGAQGSGKTNTCLHLLDELWNTHKMPFLAIESAKSEYRNLLLSTKSLKSAGQILRLATIRFRPSG